MFKELSAFTYFMLGALAKMVATLITYPLQVVQSRLRVSLTLMSIHTASKLEFAYSHSLAI